MYHSATVVMSSAKLVSFPLKLVVFEADVHDPISNMIRIPILQWCVVKCGFKNGHPKCVQHLLSIMGLTIDIIGETNLIVLWL